MDFDPQDQEIIRLLTRLKDADVAYPKDMLAARRGKFLKQMSEIGSGSSTGGNPGIKDGPTVPTPSLSPGATTLLEGALIVAIIAETGAMAYFYRDKLADFFQTITTTPRVQEISPQLVVTTALEIQGVIPSAAVTSTLPLRTISASPSETEVVPTRTPIPRLADETNTANAIIIQSDSTPVPNVGNDPNGNNGNHYGQTPRPERTKENNGNTNSNGNQNNNSNQNQNNRRP